MAATTVLPAKAAEQDYSPEFYLWMLAKAMKAKHGGEWKVDINHIMKTAIVFRS